jgi:hypothetical protein
MTNTKQNFNTMSRAELERKRKVINFYTFGYGAPEYDAFGTKGGNEYYQFNDVVYSMDKNDRDNFYPIFDQKLNKIIKP